MGAKDPIVIQVNDLETAKKFAVWGTRGKNGDQPLTYVPLCQCESSHLRAILETQTGIGNDYRMIIEAILEDRAKVAKVRQEGLTNA